MVGIGGKTVHRQITIIGSPSVFGQSAEVNANSELKVKHTDAIPVTDNAGSLTVDGSVTVSGTVTANAGTGTLATDPIDDATRDLGKVDIASLDQYAPQDVDSGAPVVNAMPVVLKKTAAGAPDLGTATDPIRTDPTGTTTQPVSGTVSVVEPVSVDDNAGSLTVDQATATNLKTEAVGASADNSANVTTKQPVIPARANAADPTWTEGNQIPLSADLSGRVRTSIGLWIGSAAPTVGQKTKANSLPVAIASDQDALPVTDNAGSLTVDAPLATPVPVSITNTADAQVKPGDSVNNAIRVNIVAGAGSGGTAQADRSAFTDGTTSMTPIGGVVNDTPTDPTEDQAAAVRITPKRAMHVNIRDDAGDSAMDDANNALRVNVVAGAGSGTEYVEDAASITDPQGGQLMARRRDALTSETSADGDVTALNSTSKGELYVKQTDVVPVSDNGGSITVDGTVSVAEPVSVDDNAGSLTVDNAGTFATQDSEKVADNAAFTDGTTKLMPIGFIFDETVGTALTENDIAAARLDSKRAVVSVIEDETTRGRRATVTAANALKVDASAVAVPVTDNSGSLTVDQATATNLKAEVVGPTADNAANPTAKLAVLPVKATAADPTFTEGNVNPLSTDLAGLLRAKLSSWLGSIAPTVGSKTSANSIPIVIASDQGNVPVSQATAANLKTEPAGNVAHDAADSGNPIKIGGKARTTNPTAVADADRVDAYFDDLGKQVVILNGPRDLETHNTITLSTTTETTLLAQVASTFLDLVLLTIANTSATAVRIDFRDTTGGAVIFSLYCPAGTTVGFAPPVPVKQTTVNTNWTAQLSAAVTDVRIFAQCCKNI